jgi:hypothetical protein
MEAIYRGEGTTESERYLASIADHTFLDLWSYANTFSAPGKELCDLLVVCGDDVIIFSDKTISWPEKGGELAWRRWYKAAIAKSISQVRGAERVLRTSPSNLFVDPACKQALPIPLPAADRRRVHGVIVALGAEAACRDWVNNEFGSFMIIPELTGSGHENALCNGFPLFGFGDVNESGIFVHIFDRVSLNVLMRELDTVSDLTRYLTKRADLIRSKRLFYSPSEPDLLAHYLRDIEADGEHGFVRPGGGEWREGEQLLIEDRLFTNTVSRPEYRRKRSADRISYVWDRLITQFTKHILGGTIVSVRGETPSATDGEEALRVMARENRTSRRILGQALINALKEAERTKTPRFARCILPGALSADAEAAYVFLILARPRADLPGGYDRYRRTRQDMLQGYCLCTLQENKGLKRVVGIAMDAASSVTGLQGSSEDLIMIDLEERSDSLEVEAAAYREVYDIFNPKKRRLAHMQIDEYPQEDGSGISVTAITRQQRRARDRKMNKRKNRK